MLSQKLNFVSIFLAIFCAFTSFRFSFAAAMKGEGSDYGKGGTVEVNKMTTYYPMEGGSMEGGCAGGGKNPMNPCDHLLDDALSGKSKCVVAATQRGGGSAALYGCKTQVPQLTQAVGKPVTVCFADIYASSQNADIVGHSKFDVAMLRSSPFQSKVTSAPSGTVSCEGRNDGAQPKERGVKRDPDASAPEPPPGGSSGESSDGGDGSDGGGGGGSGGGSNGGGSGGGRGASLAQRENRADRAEFREPEKPKKEFSLKPIAPENSIGGSRRLVKGELKRDLSGISDGDDRPKKGVLNGNLQVSYATGGASNLAENRNRNSSSGYPSSMSAKLNDDAPTAAPRAGSAASTASGGSSGSQTGSPPYLAAASTTSEDRKLAINSDVNALSGEGHQPATESADSFKGNEPVESFFGIEEEEGHSLFQRIHNYLRLKQGKGEMSAKH